MKRLPALLVLALVSALMLVSCGKQAVVSEAVPLPTADTNRQVFQVRGVIKRVVPAEQRAVIVHEEITNYMAAMTMPFHVRDTNELAGLKPGDAISFQYVVLPDDDWIENIRHVKAAPVVNVSSNGISIVPVVDSLKVGDAIPTGTFTNHHGQPVSLTALRGQAVALGFFYSRGPAMDVCPRQTAEFTKTAF